MCLGIERELRQYNSECGGFIVVDGDKKVTQDVYDAYISGEKEE